MKQKNRRQLLAAMAAMAILVPAGGVVRAEFNADTILASESERDTLAAGDNQYFYGVTGGNVYLDNSMKGLVSDINSVINYSMDDSADDGLTAIAKQAVSNLLNSKAPEVAGAVQRVEDKVSASNGQVVINEPLSELNLKGYEGKDWTRYYGAIGGDTAISTGITGKVNVSADATVSILNVNVVNIDHTYTEPDKTIIDRHGDVMNHVGSDASSVSVIGGVGGSAAMAVGNLTADMEKEASKNFSVSAINGTITANIQDVKLQGEAATTIHGNVNTLVHKDANVVGWMNGGLAAGVGGKADSTVTGDTAILIDGTDRRTDIKLDQNPDQLANGLNMMKGSGVNAIGVTGGGAAVTTLGGTAESTVGGSTAISVDDATVIGVFGGGAAASVDATGVLEKIYQPGGKELQLGNDNGTADINGAQIDALLKEQGILGPGSSLGGILGENSGLVPDDLTITATDVINGGTATSTTGDTYLNITGDSTVIGAVGGGLVAASHTYTYKGDKTAEGGNVNDAWGSSNATVNTGKSNIVVNLKGSQDVGALGDAVQGVIGAVKGGEIDDDKLSGLKGQGMALGVFGGGVAVGQGSLRATLSEGNGATAIANTAGSDIALESGYAAAVFGGGAAVTENLARAEANMTDDVNITTYSDMKTVGIFGGGLALSMEGEAGSDGYRAAASETLAKSDVGTVNITNNGDTDGIFGGGMAIGNSNRNAEYNDAVSSVQTSNITVNNGTVDNLNMEAFMSALKNGNTDGDTYPQWSVLGVNASGAMADLKGIMDETSIAAGGLGMGMTGEATVETANVTFNGGTVAKDILGGGIGIDNIGEKGGAHVGTSTITLNGGTVEGSVYAGGAVNGSTPGQVDAVYSSIGYDASNTSSTVGNATVTLNGTAVTGEISGQGYSKETQYTNNDFDPYNSGNSVTYGNKALYKSVNGTSTLNIVGTNTLSALDNSDKKYTSDSKIHDFTNVNVAANSVTKVEGLTANNTTALIKGGKVTTDAGAYLDISKLNADGPYLIADETQQGSTFWSDDALVYDRMSGVFATTDIGAGDSSYTVNYEAITEDNVDAATQSYTKHLNAGPLYPTVRDAMLKGWEPSKGLTAGGVQYFRDWMDHAPAMDAQYGRGVMIGEDAAVTGNTVSIARDMADNVMQRLSFTDDYVQDAGWVNNDGGIWAKYIHRKYETDGMGSSFGGIHSSTDYDGAIVGVDFQKSGKFQSGIAFHYGSGDGDGVISHNDYDAWGFTLYGSMKDEEAHTNLMADIGYVTSDNDIDGTVAGKHMSADRDVDAWTIGLRGEKEYVFGQNQLVPYVGLRYMSVNPARYSVYYDGQKAFNADADNQNLWLLPIGVSFRNETKTDAGWRITPKLDLSYIWAFGDTDTDMTIDMGGVGSGLYYDVMDDNSWLASLGVEASKDVWSFGVGYGYQKGDDTKNKTWYVNASYAF